MTSVATATHLGHALLLREMRNECAQFMTRYTEKIGIFAQLKWFYTKYLPELKAKKAKAYIFYYLGSPVAYGYVTIEGKKVWLTGGVKEFFRGKAFGKELFNHLLWDNRDKIPYLEVLKSNERAIKLYKKLGFELVSENERIYTMKRSKK